MRFDLTARRAYLAPALGLMLITAMSACSSGSGSSSSTASAAPTAPAASSAPAATGATATPAAGGTGSAASEITANWNTFFNSSTPTSKREQLLQNGTQFGSALGALGSIPVSSKVDAVAVDSSTKATVTYDLTAMGQSVASGQKGSSVLQDNVWKVGDDVLCGLLTEGKSVGMVSSVPAACSSVS